MHLKKQTLSAYPLLVFRVYVPNSYSFSPSKCFSLTLSAGVCTTKKRKNLNTKTQSAKQKQRFDIYTNSLYIIIIITFLSHRRLLIKQKKKKTQRRYKENDFSFCVLLLFYRRRKGAPTLLSFDMC
mgnify:CR=1 FL=1